MTRTTAQTTLGNGKAPLSLSDIEEDLQRTARREERRQRLAGVLYPAATMGVLLILWSFAIDLFGVPHYLLPAPFDVIRELVVGAEALAHHTLATTVEIVLGYSLSVLTAIPLALAIFASRKVSRSVYPLVVVSQTVPKSALAPLFIVWFGFGITSKVMITFLISFFPILISTVVGLESIEKEKVWLAKSMGLSRWSTFFKVRLPQALPSIFGGLKVATTLAVIGAVVGEFVGADSGLGYLLLVANGNLNTALLFAGLVCLTLLGITFFGLVGAIERLAIPWHFIRRGGDGSS